MSEDSSEPNEDRVHNPSISLLASPHPSRWLPPEAHVEPPPAPAAEVNTVLREALWEQWGPFTLAPHCSHGVVKAYSVACHLHHGEGPRCSKMLRFDSVLPMRESKRRIKQWCLGGFGIPDGPGAKAAHMSDNPRLYLKSDVPAEDVLDLQLVTRIASLASVMPVENR